MLKYSKVPYGLDAIIDDGMTSRHEIDNSTKQGEHFPIDHQSNSENGFNETTKVTRYYRVGNYNDNFLHYYHCIEFSLCNFSCRSSPNARESAFERGEVKMNRDISSSCSKKFSTQ